VKDRYARAVVVASREPEDPRDKEVSELYVAYRKGVRAYLINSVAYPEHEADDVVQDTILIIRDRWEPSAHLGKARGLLVQDCRTAGPGDCRGSGLGAVVASIPMIFCAFAPSLDDPCGGGFDLRAALTVLLRGLPVGQRRVLWLREGSRVQRGRDGDDPGLAAWDSQVAVNAAKRRLKELLRTNGACGRRNSGELRRSFQETS